MPSPHSGPAAAPDPRRPPSVPPSAHARAAAPPAGPDEDDTTFDDPGGDDTRHDGFGPAKRRIFLKTLAKTGCVADGCRAAGISDTTAYNHRAADPDLAALWRIALSRAAADIELLAWERGVTGIEEAVYAYGKFSHVRIRRNDTIFLRLLEASNPKKYGRRAAPPRRKRILKEERKAMEREIRAKIAAEQPSAEQINEQLTRSLKALRLRKGVQRAGAAELPDAAAAVGAPGRAKDAAPDASPAEAPDSVSEAPPPQAAEPAPAQPAPGESELKDTPADTGNEDVAAPTCGHVADADPLAPAPPGRDRSLSPTDEAHALGKLVDSAPKSPTSPLGARAGEGDDPG